MHRLFTMLVGTVLTTVLVSPVLAASPPGHPIDSKSVTCNIQPWAQITLDSSNLTMNVTHDMLIPNNQDPEEVDADTGVNIATNTACTLIVPKTVKLSPQNTLRTGSGYQYTVADVVVRSDSSLPLTHTGSNHQLGLRRGNYTNRSIVISTSITLPWDPALDPAGSYTGTLVLQLTSP